MGLGRYVLNIGIISSVLSVFGVRKQTQRMPRDWRRALVWCGWLLGLISAVSSVRYQDTDAQQIQHNKKQATADDTERKTGKKSARKHLQ